MIKKIQFLLILSLLLSGCAANQSNFVYKKDPLPTDFKKQKLKLDFSKGEWLLGNIEINANVEEKFTEMVVEDFKTILDTRLKKAENQKKMLLGKTPLNPTEKQIEDLKTGTGFDFYINIKCNSGTTDLSNFNWTENSYFKSQYDFATLTIEIYDLNLQKIVYSLAAKCSMEKRSIILNDKSYFTIKSSYKKIFQNIKKLHKQQ